MQISSLLLALLPTITLAAAQATDTFINCNPKETNLDVVAYCARTALGFKPAVASYIGSQLDHNSAFIAAFQTVTAVATLATNPVDQILEGTGIISQLPESLRAPYSSILLEELALQTGTATAGAAPAATSAAGSAKPSGSSGAAPALPRQTAVGVAAGVLAGFVGMAIGM